LSTREQVSEIQKWKHPFFASIDQGLHGVVLLDDCADPAAESAVSARRSCFVHHQRTLPCVCALVERQKVAIVVSPGTGVLEKVAPYVFSGELRDWCIHERVWKRTVA